MYENLRYEKILYMYKNSSFTYNSHNANTQISQLNTHEMRI